MKKPNEADIIQRLRRAQKEFSDGVHMFAWQQEAAKLVQEAAEEIERLRLKVSI